MNVTLSLAGTTEPNQTFSPTTDNQGYFTVTLSIAPDTYDLVIRGNQIPERRYTVTLVSGYNSFQLGTLLTGSHFEGSAGTSSVSAGQTSVAGTYVVQHGDTLYHIAVRFGTTMQAIIAANHLSYPWIKSGQTLIIPGGNPAVVLPDVTPTPVTPATGNQPGSQAKTYTVKAGDNLFHISQMVGVSVDVLRTANGLSSNIIHVGQVLTIP